MRPSWWADLRSYRLALASSSLFAHSCHRNVIRNLLSPLSQHELLAMPPINDRLYSLNSELESFLPHCCFCEDSVSARRKASGTVGCSVLGAPLRPCCLTQGTAAVKLCHRCSATSVVYCWLCYLSIPGEMVTTWELSGSPCFTDEKWDQEMSRYLLLNIQRKILKILIDGYLFFRLIWKLSNMSGYSITKFQD